jgi:hypothetical protein
MIDGPRGLARGSGLVEPSHALDVPGLTKNIVGPDEWTDIISFT